MDPVSHSPQPNPTAPNPLSPIFIVITVLAIGLIIAAVSSTSYALPNLGTPSPTPTMTHKAPTATIEPTPITHPSMSSQPNPNQQHVHTTQTNDTLAMITETYYGTTQALPELIDKNKSYLTANGISLTNYNNPLPLGLILFVDHYNIALNKPIVYSTGQVIYNDYQERFPPHAITDGNPYRGWRNQTDQPGQSSKAIIDLESNATIYRASYKVSWDPKTPFDDTVTIKLTSLSNPHIQANDQQILSQKQLVRADINQFITVDFPLTQTRYIGIEYMIDDDQWAGWGNIEEVRIFKPYTNQPTSTDSFTPSTTVRNL